MTWILYTIIVIFIITAVSNGANITDGLDGLATGVSAIIGICLGIFAYASGNIRFAEYLNIMYIPNLGELSIFIGALIGACVGFLWYNALSGAGVYGGYRKPHAWRNYCGAGDHRQKRIADPDFLRRVPGRKPKCGDTGFIFQIHEEENMVREEEYS